MAEPEPVYFDSCLFIELLQQSIPERFHACEAIRLRAQRSEVVIVTSAITIVEVNKLPELGALAEEQSRKILEFFENEYIAIRPLDRGTAEEAHKLTRTHGLANADAIHVATAIRSRVSVLYTYDAVKGRRKGLLGHNLKVGIPPLRIEKPPDPDKGTLLDESHVAKLAAMKNDSEPPQGGDGEKATSQAGEKEEDGAAIAAPADTGRGAKKGNGREARSRSKEAE